MSPLETPCNVAYTNAVVMSLNFKKSSKSMKITRFQQNILWYSIGPLLIVISLIVAYRPSLSYEFQFDDLANITKHFNIRHYTLGQLFFSGTRWISYWLNAFFYSIGKFDPLVYRVGSLTIHAINAILVFVLFSLLMPRVCGDLEQKKFFMRYAWLLSLLTALLFALHPVQTQTVTYVIQSELEGLATMSITLMSLLFMIRAIAQNTAAKTIVTFFLLMVAVLSTGTKEIAIIGPVLVMLIDWFFVSCASWKNFKKNIWLHALLMGLIFGTYIYLLKPTFFIKAFGLQMQTKNNIGNIITANPGEIITPFHYFISQFKVIVHYLLMFVWPFNISVEYDWKLVDSFFAIDCIVPLLMLCLLGLLIVFRLRNNKTDMIAFGLLWFFIALAPRSTIIPSPELLVDYKTYLGSFGFLFVLAIVLVCAIEKITTFIHNNALKKYGCYVLIPLLIVLCVPLTIVRNKVWSSGCAFWMNIITNAPGKARAYNNYGVELSQKHSKFKESIPYFQKAIAMDPLYPDPCNNLAVAYGVLGQIDNAIFVIKKGLAMYPYYPEGYNNLASFYLQKKEYESAKKALDIAIALRPHYGKAHYNLGRLHLEQGNNEKAWEHFKLCCTQGDLDEEVGFDAYAQASLLCKKYEDAQKAYSTLVAMRPDNNDALFGLGNSYYFQQKYNEARAVYMKALAKNPHDHRFWYNLGEAYFADKQFVAAIEWFEKMMTLPQKPINTFVRLATCYEVVGKTQQAYNLLASLEKVALSDADASMIKSTLGKMKQQYPSIVV